MIHTRDPQRPRKAQDKSENKIFILIDYQNFVLICVYILVITANLVGLELMISPFTSLLQGEEVSNELSSLTNYGKRF